MNTNQIAQKGQNFENVIIPRDLFKVKPFARDRGALQLWIQLLFDANHPLVYWKGIEVDRGSAVVSYEYLTKKLNSTMQGIADAITVLSANNEINVHDQNGVYFVVTINEFDSYIDDEL